jgi:ParB family chromosome partitioning protein
MVGLQTIPAYIRTINDENVMEMALVENIQREDLNAIEIALAYQHLMDSTGMTQEKVSERVGKSRTAVANYLRLLKLPAQVQMALQNKSIDMGHARALLALDSPAMQIKLFKEVEKNGYSVRKVEEMVKSLNNGDDTDTAKKKVAAKTPMPEEFSMLKNRLSDFFRTKVQLVCSAKGKGKISIPFSNEEELEHIMNVFDKLKN